MAKRPKKPWFKDITGVEDLVIMGAVIVVALMSVGAIIWYVQR